MAESHVFFNYCLMLENKVQSIIFKFFFQKGHFHEKNI